MNNYIYSKYNPHNMASPKVKPGSNTSDKGGKPKFPMKKKSLKKPSKC